MNDGTTPNGNTPHVDLGIEAGEAGPYGNEHSIPETGSESKGAFGKFISNQPLLTLTIAFGVGLLATSLLARRQ
jgi:hypothetical protein